MHCGRNDLESEQTERPEHKGISAASKFSREKSYSRNVAGSRPKRLVGKADDTDEETGKCSLWDRRGTGSSISGKIFRDNVGKNPLAAGAGSNLPRLTEGGESQMGLAHESVGAMTEE